MYPPKLKENLKDESTRVDRMINVNVVLTKCGQLNLRATEKKLEAIFFEELGELVKMKIRREL